MEHDDLQARLARALASHGDSASELFKQSERLRALFDTAPSSPGPVEIPNEWLADILGVRNALKNLQDAAARFAGFAELWNNAEGQGWIRLCELLRTAADDPLVKASDPAASFLSIMSTLAEDAIGAKSAEQALAPLESASASVRAKAKHAKHAQLRKWVQSEWVSHADEYERNKTAFARVYERRCWNEHDTQVRQRTIAADWLKGK